jgi:imidazolonepropionase
VVDEILPAAAELQLATAADVFIEKGAFTVEHGRRILTAAKDLGLKLHVHAEQLSWSGGARLAAELGAQSVGHLEFATEEDAKALAEAGVVGEVLSTAQVFLGMQERVPGRMLADAGVTLAVATDFNPGSANILDLHLAAGLAVTMGGLSAEEALWGITRGGALALGQEDAGQLVAGARADLVILRGPAAWDLVYAWGTDHVAHVVVGGEHVIGA